jgi:hypothetical protein
MTNDVENPKVKQLLERIESETMTAKQLMTLYNNTLKYKGISDLERELIIAAIEKDLKLNCPKEASKKFGSKDADGRVLLETVYEKIKSEFDLSGNHVGNGIKVGGDMMAGRRYVEIYFSYKNSDKWNGGLYYRQDKVDSEPYLKVILYQVGKGNEDTRTEHNYSVDAVDLAVEDLTNTLRKIVN